MPVVRTRGAASAAAGPRADPRRRSRSRAPVRLMDLRPGAQEHLQPLPRLLAAGEDDAVLAPARLGAGGIRTPFGTTSYSPGSHRCAEARACSETAIRWSSRSSRKPQTGIAEPHPAELAGRMVRADHRAVPERERRDARDRRHRLVQVQHVEPLPLEHAPDPEDERGLRMMFGSEPFAGTITERPIGITSGGGLPCRPTRGCSARVN